MKIPIAHLLSWVFLWGVLGLGYPSFSFAAPTSGTLWVFAVGVSQYRNTAISLQYADNDAEALAKTLQAQSNKTFQQVATKVLTNQQTSKKTILQEMHAFFAQATADDAAFIALMGHGVVDQGVYYFLPHPADLSNLSTEGLPLADLENEVKTIGRRVPRLIFVVDTCFSGALEIRTRSLTTKGPQRERPRAVALASTLAPQLHEAYILSASKDNEESWEHEKYRLPGEDKGHGAFTFALLRGLRGEADLDHDRVVNVLDLFTYASSQVPKITNDKQHPYFRGEGTNFPLAEVGPPATAEQIQEAKNLVQQGLAQRQQGQLDLAEKSFAQAQDLNPHDEVPALLHADVKEETTYRGDPQKQQQVAEQAKQLTAETREASTAKEDPWTPHPTVLTFLDFSTLGSGQQNNGLHEALVQRIAQALQGMKRIRVVDRRELERILQNFNLSASDLADPSTRLKKGLVLIFRLLATGNIVAVSDKHFIFNLRVIDAETTETSFQFSKDAKDPEQILALADEVALTLMQQIQQELPLRGKILAVDQKEVVLNIGAHHGLTPGAHLKAIVEEPVKVGDEIVAQRKKPIATLEVTAVEEKAAFAKVLDQQGPLEKGTKVLEALPENRVVESSR